MRHKQTFRIAILIFMLTIIVLSMALIKGKKNQDALGPMQTDGEGVSHMVFNDENESVMNVKFASTKKVGEDKVLMKEVEALIFKNGRMSSDIKILGREGESENNFHNFIVRNAARLVSKDFNIRSDHFSMTDRDIVRTQQKVSFETKQLNGVARDGLEMYVNQNVLKMFNVRGHYKKDNRDFTFKTNIFWVIDNENRIVMEMGTEIRDDTSRLRTNWLTITFSPEFKHIVESSAQRQSYLYFEDPKTGEKREIKANNITSAYDDSGRLNAISAMQNVEIQIQDKDHNTLISGNMVKIAINPENGRIKTIDLPMPGQVENSGKSAFQISANIIKAVYNEKAQINYCEGQGECRYIIRGYSGKTDLLAYNTEKETIVLDGDKSEIQSKNNIFNSSRFDVNTKERTLKTLKKINSSISPGKKNVLFSKNPLFINADEFEIQERKNRIIYRKKVNLIQGDTALRASMLELIEDKSTSAEGDVVMTFKNGSQEVSIKGQRLFFEPETKRINVSGDAVIINSDNQLKAQLFRLEFSDNNELARIIGENDVRLIRKDIMGSSGKVEWDFKKETMLLRNKPQIDRREGGTTYGELLKIDLKTNKITVQSGDMERAETILH